MTNKRGRNRWSKPKPKPKPKPQPRPTPSTKTTAKPTTQPNFKPTSKPNRASDFVEGVGEQVVADSISNGISSLICKVANWLPQCPDTTTTTPATTTTTTPLTPVEDSKSIKQCIDIVKQWTLHGYETDLSCREIVSCHMVVSFYAQEHSLDHEQKKKVNGITNSICRI